ncbi:MAG: hypothetical protein QHJ82_03130, partial [Verrucomicrobiota bacterium]|nr:hypothetical protein [Verrucomicrobiota bacterium]
LFNFSVSASQAASEEVTTVRPLEVSRYRWVPVTLRMMPRARSRVSRRVTESKQVFHSQSRLRGG